MGRTKGITKQKIISTLIASSMDQEEHSPKEEYANWKAPDASTERADEKQKRWDQITAEIETIGDLKGHGIDERIKKPIIGLMGFEFPTSQSCEGHLDQKSGTPFPWVQIEVYEPNKYNLSPEMQTKWVALNQIQRDKMVLLLEEFYAGRDTPPDAKIIMDGIGQYGAFQLQSQGAKEIEDLPKSGLADKYNLYSNEMADFGTFLKEKFFKS
jgi:hypothetical protein